MVSKRNIANTYLGSMAATLGAMMLGNQRKVGIFKPKSLPSSSVLMKAGKAIKSYKTSIVRKKRPYVTSNKGGVGSKVKRRKKTFRGRKSKIARSLTKTVRKAIQEEKQSTSVYRKNRFGELRIRNQMAGAGIKGIVSNFSKVTTPEAGVTVRQFEFVYFNQLKLADAIAICYNGKSQGGDWTNVTTNFEGNSLKTRIPYASAHLTIKNQTAYTFDVNVHVFTCHANTSTSPLESYKAQKAANPKIEGSYTDLDNGIRLEYGAKIEDIPLPDFSRTTVRYKNVVPGQHLDWMGSIKDYMYDEPKLTLGSTGAKIRFTKGCKVLLFEFVPLLSSINGTVSGDASASTGSVGNPPGPAVTSSNYFAFHENEYYKVVQPEETKDANEGHKLKIFTDTDLKGMAPITSVVQKYLALPNIDTANSSLT